MLRRLVRELAAGGARPRRALLARAAHDRPAQDDAPSPTSSRPASRPSRSASPTTPSLSPSSRRPASPIAAPSANRSGRPSPTRAAHVAADFPGLLVLDGGPARHGLESTVVALGDPPRILRLGAIPLEELRAVLPGLVVATKARARAESPGMKHRHYAPGAAARPLPPLARGRPARGARGRPEGPPPLRRRRRPALPAGRAP